ncbi:MAG: hypothetical protein VZR95_05985 [Alphaproteobacteria bacterium]
MKKLVFVFCFLFVSTAFAYDGTHLVVNDEFLEAFKNCTPYKQEVPDKESMPKNNIVEEYESFKIIGKKDGFCFFDLIMQMSSKSLYSIMQKRCAITDEQNQKILKALKNVQTDNGRQYSSEISSVMDQCVVVYDIIEEANGKTVENYY